MCRIMRPRASRGLVRHSIKDIVLPQGKRPIERFGPIAARVGLPEKRDSAAPPFRLSCPYHAGLEHFLTGARHIGDRDLAARRTPRLRRLGDRGGHRDYGGAPHFASRPSRRPPFPWRAGPGFGTASRAPLLPQTPPPPPPPRPD